MQNDSGLLEAASKNCINPCKSEDPLYLEAEYSFLSSIIDSIGMIIMAVDLDGRIVKLKHRCCERIQGLTFQALKEKPIWDLLKPEEEDMVRVKFQRLFEGRPTERHISHLNMADGSHRLFMWYNTGVTDTRGLVKYIICIGRDITNQDRITERLNSLSERQHEIMKLIIAGKPNKIIAPEMCISEKTVEYHRGRIMRKMGVYTVAELVHMVMCSGRMCACSVLE
jgi:PAS domain S-box-containing protein